MKKLMIAAAAAVCGSVFALESANIVGYSDKALRDAHKMICPQFKTVGANATKLGDLTVTGYDAFDPNTFMGGSEGQVYIKILANNGAIAKDDEGNDLVYFWYDGMSTDSLYGNGLGKGWYTSGPGTKYDGDTIEFAAGDGLWVYGVAGYYLNIKSPVASN